MAFSGRVRWGLSPWAELEGWVCSLEEGLGRRESGGSFSWCPLLWRIYFGAARELVDSLDLGSAGSCHLQEGREGAGELGWALPRGMRGGQQPSPFPPANSKMPPLIPV